MRLIGKDEAQICELGPEVDPDDVDGRMPAVVAWSVGDMFYLVGSYQLPANALVRIAESLG